MAAACVAAVAVVALVVSGIVKTVGKNAVEKPADTNKLLPAKEPVAVEKVPAEESQVRPNFEPEPRPFPPGFGPRPPFGKLPPAQRDRP